MKKILSAILAAVMLLSLCLMVTGCKSDGGASKKGRLAVWVGTDLEELFTKIAEDYTKETGVPVSIFTYTGLTASDKLALDGPFGKGGDIYVQGGGGDLAKAVEQGLFLELSKDAFQLESKYISGAQELMQYQGKLYGVPLGIETTALIYNKDILPEFPETWEELVAFAQSYNHFGEGVKTKDQAFGLLVDYSNPYYTWAINEAFGGYIFGQDENGAYDPTDLGIDNDGSIAACEFIKGLIDDRTIPTDMTITLMQSKFQSGKAAVILDGSWDLANFRKAGINVGVAPIPDIPTGNGEHGTPVTFCGGYGLAISSFSLNQDESRKFLEFATKDEYLLGYYEVTGRIPATISSADNETIKSDECLKGFYAQLENSYPQPAINELNAVWDPLTASTTSIYINSEDIATTMHKVAEDIKANIALLNK